MKEDKELVKQFKRSAKRREQEDRYLGLMDYLVQIANQLCDRMSEEGLEVDDIDNILVQVDAKGLRCKAEWKASESK